MKTKLVTIGADATVYVGFLDQVHEETEAASAPAVTGRSSCEIQTTFFGTV